MAIETVATKPVYVISGPDAPSLCAFNVPTGGLPWSRLSRFTKEDAARHIVFWLLKEAEGPLDDPQTWENVAIRRNIHIHDSNERSDGRGCYYPPSREAPDCVGGGIFVNKAFDVIDQLRGWVHELAHERLYFWQVGVLHQCADSFSYDGDVDDEHEDICLLAEELMYPRETALFLPDETNLNSPI